MNISDRAIAFDLDGTVVDGLASRQIADYINRHPEKSYFIVTFRTPDQMHSLPDELDNVGLSREQFRQIVPMPKRMAFEFEEDQIMRRHAGMPRISEHNYESLFPGEYKFVHWKGFVTKKLGATTLIDDMPALSKPGCDKFHIKLLEPDVFMHQHSAMTERRRPNKGVMVGRLRIVPAHR